MASSIMKTVLKTVLGAEFSFTSAHKAVLVTNVASMWGATSRHYAQMNDLYSTYGNQGLEIIAFPSTDFNQEYKTDEEVAKFVLDKKDVKFTVTSLAHVNGPNQHPMYTQLKAATSNDDIAWNFATYFLVDVNQNTVTRHNKIQPKDLDAQISSILSANASL